MAELQERGPVRLRNPHRGREGQAFTTPRLSSAVRASRVAVAALVLLLSGCTDFEAEKPENRIGILSIDVAAPEVAAGTVQLEVTTTLDNLQAESGRLQVQVKAFDADTNMLVANGTAEVGAMQADQSKAVPIRLALPRSSGYRMEVLVHQDGRIVQRGEVTVANLQGLEPTLYDTGLRIMQIDTQVLGTADGRVKVRCPVYITNEGGQASRALRLQLKAREVSTSILADEAWLDVPSVGRDQTAVHEVELEMPDEFNYALEAFIWDGPVIVERGEGKVQFLPTYTEQPGTRLKVSNPDISRFIDRGEPAAGGSGYGSDYYGGGTTTSTPGLELPAAALGLLLVVLALRWRKTR